MDEQLRQYKQQGYTAVSILKEDITANGNAIFNLNRCRIMKGNKMIFLLQ